MVVKNTFYRFFLFFLLGLSSFLIAVTGLVESSITPSVDYYESVNSLCRNKYSIAQYEEINSALFLKDEKIRIVSYNVLFSCFDAKQLKVNRWPQRWPRVLALIEEMDPELIGMQELSASQAKDLLPLMQKNYGFFSNDLKEGDLGGIFYRLDRFELIEGDFWSMSPNSEEPSLHTLTMVKLKDKLTGKSMAVFNVHLAFGKIEKRDFQAKFIARHIESFAGGLPIILVGDMNTFAHRLDLERLPFYDGDYIHRILTRGALKDAREKALLGHLGPLSTFTNADEKAISFTGTGTPGVFLDHIYVSQEVNVLIHAVQPATVDGHYPSDHMPIMIDFLLI